MAATTLVFTSNAPGTLTTSVSGLSSSLTITFSGSPVGGIYEVTTDVILSSIPTTSLITSTAVRPFPTSTPSGSSTSASSGGSTILNTTRSDTATRPVETAGNTLIFSTTINATTTGPNGVSFTAVVNNGSLVRDVVQEVGLKPGPVAGIAIALAVIGALVAIGAMLLLQAKRKKKHRTSRRSNHTGNVGGHGYVETIAARVGEKDVVTADVTDPDYLLPQPRDDQSMGAAANKLFVQIGNHVENFYHNDSVRESMSARSEEEQLLIGRKTRFFALKRHICHDMLAAMAWDCPPEHSFLPAAAVSMAQKMPRGDLDEKAYEVAWSRWRVSTCMLLRDDDQSQKVQAYEFWLDRLQRQLQPFQINDSESMARASEDLHAICKMAQGLAKLLCSQGARWEFYWPGDASRSQIVVFPEFIRRTDSKGRRLERAVRILEAQKMQ